MTIVIATSIIGIIIGNSGDPFKFSVRGNEISLPSNITYVTTNNLASKLDKRIVHTKNSLGFRGEDPPADLEGTLSIIAVGGSTTESRSLSDEKEWVFILRKELSNHFDPLWINNAGLDGHSTFGRGDQEGERDEPTHDAAPRRGARPRG